MAFLMFPGFDLTVIPVLKKSHAAVPLKAMMLPVPAAVPPMVLSWLGLPPLSTIKMPFW
jgi:hypothetical protein